MLRRRRIIGDEKINESNLSNAPPCPGTSAEESFIPASRLNSDSIKSPICPNVPIIIPIPITEYQERKSNIISFV